MYRLQAQPRMSTGSKSHGCISICLFPSQGNDTVLEMPLLPKKARGRQECSAGAPRQSLLGSLGWALASGVGMLYLAAVLCLCAWPCVHFIVQFAQHFNMVSLSQPHAAFRQELQP